MLDASGNPVPTRGPDTEERLRRLLPYCLADVVWASRCQQWRDATGGTAIDYLHLCLKPGVEANTQPDFASPQEMAAWVLSLPPTLPPDPPEPVLVDYVAAQH